MNTLVEKIKQRQDARHAQRTATRRKPIDRGSPGVRDSVGADDDGQLDDGRRIEIGSVPGAGAGKGTWPDPGHVLRIVSSYQSLAGGTPSPRLQN